MSDAPQRIWMDPDIRFPECEKQYGCDVEYIRADIHRAELEAVREWCAKIADRYHLAAVEWFKKTYPNHSHDKATDSLSIAQEIRAKPIDEILKEIK